MKQKYPANGSNQLFGRNKSQLFSGAYDSGARHHFYRSVILAVSGSLFCVAAGERAAAQSSDVVSQSSGQTFGEMESAQISPRANFGGLNMSTPLICSDFVDSTTSQYLAMNVDDSPLWHPGEQLELFNWKRSTTNVGISPAVSAPPAAAPVASVPPASAPDASAPPVSAAPGSDTTPTLTLPGLPIQQPTVHRNELSISADFMYGIGTITVPVGYGLHSQSLGPVNFKESAVSADRSTVYYGGTLSYSYGRSWYLDISGEDGRSTGSTGINIPGLAGSIPASFDVDDTWYQVYLRYNFQNFLAGTRFRAYLRGGVSLVKATLTTVNNSFSPQFSQPGDFYSEHDNTLDELGNIGFGLSYSLYSTVRLKVGLQLEGEGFGGDRQQDITESFVPSKLTGSTTIDDTVYGAIGRLTLHGDYRLGNSGRWKMTGDLGIMSKNSWVSYPGFGTKDETLYGPYAKIGASFVF